MSNELKSLESIVKNKSILAASIFLLIAFIILLSYRNISVWQSLIIIIIMSFFILFFSYVYLVIIRKETVIKISSLESETELEDKKYNPLKEEGLVESIKKMNPDLSRFLIVLEKKGFKIIEELENELKKIEKKVYFVIESSENTNKVIKKLTNGKTFFTRFMQELSGEYEVIRINKMYGNNFLIIADNNFVGEDLDLINRYYSLLKKDVKKILNDGRVSDKNKEDLKNWYTNLIKNNKPIILITRPYLFSLSSMINMLSDKLSRNDKEKLFSMVNNVIKKEVRIYSIDLSYLLDAVDFEDDLIERFQQIENDLKEKIAEKLNIKNNKLFFSSSLNNKRFISCFETSLQEVDREFEGKLKDCSNYKRLIELIKHIQLNIFNLS